VRQNNFIISQRFNELRQTPLGEALETVILSAFLALLIKAFVIQAYFPTSTLLNKRYLRINEIGEIL